MKKSLNIRKPRYSECIWSVPWPFIISSTSFTFPRHFSSMALQNFVFYYLLFSRFRRGSLILGISQKNGTIVPPNLNPGNFTKFTGA